MRTAFRSMLAVRLSGRAVLAVTACGPGPLRATEPLADWDDFDTLVDETVANRPDFFYWA